MAHAFIAESRSRIGFIFVIPIAILGSLIGLGGAEFRLPVLVGPLRYTARQAVPLNLSVSLHHCCRVYGLDIKIAGTASLLISLPTVTLGIMRYARRGAIARPSVRETIVPMGVGSVIGAVIGGALLGVVSAGLLKFGLGIILIVSAMRIFGHRKGA